MSRGEDELDHTEPPALPRLLDYELVREIAQGGMSVVYEARHKILGRSVALKTIRSGTRATDEVIQRFQEEARRVAQLDHPNIVPLYEAGLEDGHHYFTMRLMEGGSLAGRMARAPFTVRQAAEVVSRITRALHFAHQRGILHRDIKPANVLFDNDGRPHLGDFGLASQLEASGAVSRLDCIRGTPMYMAPEVVSRAGEVTTAVDIYGIGAVLVRVNHWASAAPRQQPPRGAHDLAQCDPERPSLLITGMDLDLEAICLKCLDKEPGRRYGSAEALADDLDRWLRGEPVEARPCHTLRRIAKWARRSPVVTGLMVLCVTATVICIAALTVSNVSINRQKGETTRALKAETKALGTVRELLEQERRLLYLQGIALADRELQSGSPERAEKLLCESSPELRGLEWNYLARLCHGERLSLVSPADPSCVAVGPRDGAFTSAAGCWGDRERSRFTTQRHNRL